MRMSTTSRPERMPESAKTEGGTAETILGAEIVFRSVAVEFRFALEVVAR
jgi:hypothetical protein